MTAARTYALIAFALAASAVNGGAVDGQRPRVWLFCGHAGDAEHEAGFAECLSGLQKVLTETYTVPADSLRVLSGRGCPREALEAELAEVAGASQSPQPIWLFFLGHANATSTGAAYNLHGPDISARELGRAFAGVNGPAQVVVFFTTSNSGAFLRPLARPGRIVVTATMPRGETNETFFPHELLEALIDPATDADRDGAVSVLELFRETGRQVAQRFEDEQLAQTEHALLDAAGNGVGVADPDGAEAEAAAQARLFSRAGPRPGPAPLAPKAPAADEDDDWDF